MFLETEITVYASCWCSFCDIRGICMSMTLPTCDQIWLKIGDVIGSSDRGPEQEAKGLGTIYRAQWVRARSPESDSG